MRPVAVSCLDWLSAAIFAVLVGLVASAWTASAHEGHDHGAPPPPVTATIAPRAETSSNEFEAVLIARGAELIIHLDEFRTNAPIKGATLEIDSPQGILKPTATGDGVYSVAAPFLAKPGTYDLAVTISAGSSVDILTAALKVPEVLAGASVVAVTPSAGGAEGSLANQIRRHIAETPVATWLALLGAFVAGIVIARLTGRSPTAASAVVAVAVAAVALAPSPVTAETAPVAVARDVALRFPDGALFVPKPTQHILALRTVFAEERAHRRVVELPGRIVPSPNASGLVQASVGGRLSPPPGGFKPLGTRVKTGDVLAYVRPPLPLADATAQQQQARELDQQITLVQRRVERLRSIQQVIAKSQLEDAELELRGLNNRRANLERVQRDPEALVAPVDGVIAAANAVAGQMAESNSVIFQIIDPSELWIEALSYEAHATSGAARALFPDGRALDLEYLGTGFADRNQAVPIQFRIRGEVGGLRAGQFVTVIASTSEERRGIALPREAVLRAPNGQSLVYEHTNAERFVAREVRVEPLDGSLVLVVAGLSAGRRVVTQGAELLNQIR